MKFQKVLAMACVMSMLGLPVQATSIPQPLLTSVETQVSTDAGLLSGWMVNQLKYAIPFNSTAGNVVPSQLKILGIEAGIEGVVSGTKVDTNALHSLPTTLVDTKSIDTFSRFPFPMVLAHAKIGLPFGFDAGVRLGGIPKEDINNGNNRASVKNKVFGIDLRKKLIDEGALKPFGLTVGLNYTHADGSMDLTAPFDSIQYPFSSGSNTYTATLNNGIATNHADWKTNSVGVQAILDKKIFIITPYIGASANHNSGSINNTITASGTATVSDSGGTVIGSDNVSAPGSSTVNANKWDIRGLAGFELSILPFVKLGFQGEYAGDKNMAGSLGLRIQFR